MAAKIKRGDTVRVISGRAKGQEGTVIRVLRDKGMVIIEGVNLVKKHLRRSAQFPDGGIVEVPAPVRIEKVMLVCPKCGQPTRVGFKFDDEGRKYRYCKKCGEMISYV